MPFHLYICAYSAILAIHATIYYSFPLDWRMDGRFQKRLKFYIYDGLYNLVVNIQYNVAAKLLRKYNNKYQPLASLAFILVRELHAWIKRTCICKMANGDESGAKVTGIISVGMRYTMIICYTLGTISTFETEVLLMGLDFVVNIYTCVKIIWLHKRRPEDVEKQIELIQELVLNELMEFICPLSFIIAFLLAYTGPNGNVIGNINITIWHYEAIEDAPGFLKVVLILFVVDFCSTIITSLLLWFLCKINFIAVVMAIQKEYGGRIIVYLGMNLLTASYYFRTKLINCLFNLTNTKLSY